MHNIIDIFKDRGYPVPQFIKNNGKLHRFGKKQQYWYVCFENWLIAGDWTDNLSKISQPINKTSFKSLTPQQKSEIFKKNQEIFKKAEDGRKQECEKIAIKAQVLWLSLKDSGQSSYLQIKGLSSINGIKFGNDNFGNFIATALVDNNGKIWTLQKIYDKSLKNGNNKIFLKGGKIKGLYSLFGNLQGAIIYICEGIATTLSVLLAMPECLVVVAYSCHNFKFVAQNIKQKFQNKKIIIVSDNDLKRRGFYE